MNAVQREQIWRGVDRELKIISELKTEIYELRDQSDCDDAEMDYLSGLMYVHEARLKTLWKKFPETIGERWTTDKIRRAIVKNSRLI